LPPILAEMLSSPLIMHCVDAVAEPDLAAIEKLGMLDGKIAHAVAV
jgi:hypothetical protein